MVFSLKAFCSYADELARLLKLLNDIIQTNGLIVISNKNKIFTFTEYISFNDFSLSYWGINTKLEGEFIAAKHRYFTWLNIGKAYRTKPLTSTVTDRVEQLSDQAEHLDNYFDDVNVTYYIGDKGYVIIATDDKDKIKRILKVKEDVFDWRNANGTLTVRLESRAENGASFNVKQVFASPTERTFPSSFYLGYQPVDPLSKTCTKCGNRADYNANFCRVCGNAFTVTATTPSSDIVKTPAALMKDTPEDIEKIRKRGYAEIVDNAALINAAKEATNNWENKKGQHVVFATYNFNDIYCQITMLENFTSREIERLKELQESETDKYDALYNWKHFKDKPLTEEVVLRFLNKYVDKFEISYGKDSFEYLNALSTRDKKYKQWKNGEVIEVDTVSGEYIEKCFYSDGSTRKIIWNS